MKLTDDQWKVVEPYFPKEQRIKPQGGRPGVSAATVMTICGWKDYETMMIYIRRAGIDIQGATDKIQILTPAKAMERVVPLFELRGRT